MAVLFDFDNLEEMQDPIGFQAVIELDAERVPRGRCINCNRCKAWMKPPTANSYCHSCECPTRCHEDLRHWLTVLLDRMGTDMEHAIKIGLPIMAYSHWTDWDARLFIISDGAIRPSDNPLEDQRAVGTDSLVSVICPTMQERHRYHPLLYENYRQQTYEPRELVVVDTGTCPSTFLQDVAKTDKSVRYLWLNRRLSVGVKRNIACRIARGQVIVHFDDDDLYAASYVDCMARRLQQDIGKDAKTGGTSVPAVAATVSSWHIFDIAARGFKFYDVRTDEDLTWREQKAWILGWGFSFAYTKSAWDAVPFPDGYMGEDTEFMRGLLKLGVKTLMVEEAGRLCSHTFHPRVSISGGESSNGKCRGQDVPVAPACLLSSLPKLMEAEGYDVHRSSRYFLSGSWSNWERFDELHQEGRSSVYTARIPVYNPPQRLDFQVFADRDRAQCFYPDGRSDSSGALGPWRCHQGVHWSAVVPEDCCSLVVRWDPAGGRSLTWSTSKCLPIMFSAVGNWSDWQHFDEMCRQGGTLIHKLLLRGLWRTAEFQVAENRDWKRRYWPLSGKSGMESCGPGDPPANLHCNWVVKKPPACSEFDLLLAWNPSARPQLSVEVTRVY